MDLFTIKGTVEQGTLARDALCARHNYQEQIEQDNELITNPETKSQFAKRMVMEWIKNEIKAYRVDQFELGRNQTVTDAETEVNNLIVE